MSSHEEDESELPSELLGSLTGEAEKEARTAAKNAERSVGGGGDAAVEQGQAKKRKV